MENLTILLIVLLVVDGVTDAITDKPHCKYIRPDYDGTLAIHSSTYYARST